MAVPTNSTAATAIELGPTLPNTVTQDVNDSGTTYTVWYKYTAQAEDVVIGLFPYGDLVNYFVRTKIWVGSPGSLTQYLEFDGSASIDKAIQLPVVAGTVYYFECSSTGGDVSPAVLTVECRLASNLDVPAGSIFINDENDGYPLTIIDATSAAASPIRYVSPFASGEGGTALGDGMVCLEDVATNEVVIYQDITEVARASFPRAPGSQLCISSNRLNKFYLGNIGGGGASAFVRRISIAGSFEGPTWTLPTTNQLRAMAAALDDTILYFVHAVTASAIQRWDLVNNVALSNLAAGFANYGYCPDMHILADGTILVGFARTATTNPSFVVRRYDTAGTILNTYNFNFLSTTTVRMALAIDDPDSFWVKRHATGGRVHFIHVRVSDGATLATLIGMEFLEGVSQESPTTLTPAAYFGNAPSCPFWLNPNEVPLATLPNACPPANLEPEAVTPPNGCPPSTPGLG